MSGGTLTDQSSRWWSSARGRRGSAAAWESPAAPGWLGGSCCSLSSVKPLLSWSPGILFFFFLPSTFREAQYHISEQQRSFLCQCLFYKPIALHLWSVEKALQKVFRSKFTLIPNSPIQLESPLSRAFDLTQSGKGYIL